MRLPFTLSLYIPPSLSLLLSLPLYISPSTFLSLSFLLTLFSLSFSLAYLMDVFVLIFFQIIYRQCLTEQQLIIDGILLKIFYMLHSDLYTNTHYSIALLK